MNDKKDEAIIELLWARDESALAEAEKKYRAFANSVLLSFLTLKEDREECFNDALLRLWDSIPPKRPKSLSAFLAKILKNLALMRIRAENTWKRSVRSQTIEDEFLTDVSDGRTLADDYESEVTERVINEFLISLPKQERAMFVLRYWFDEDVAQIARRTGRSEGAITMRLKRLREKLRAELKKEGIIVNGK